MNHNNSYKAFSKADMEEYEQIFRTFDTDNSGEIDVVEMDAAMRELGFNHSRTQLESLIAEVDTNGNGQVDFTEFISCMKRFSAIEEEEKDVIRECMNVFDMDKDGEVNAEEFRYVMKEVGGFSTTFADFIFSEADVTGKGSLDAHVFAQFVRNYLFESTETQIID